MSKQPRVTSQEDRQDVLLRWLQEASPALEIDRDDLGGAVDRAHELTGPGT